VYRIIKNNGGCKYALGLKKVKLQLFEDILGILTLPKIR
jgi:hypothetical protein